MVVHLRDGCTEYHASLPICSARVFENNLQDTLSPAKKSGMVYDQFVGSGQARIKE